MNNLKPEASALTTHIQTKSKRANGWEWISAPFLAFPPIKTPPSPCTRPPFFRIVALIIHFSAQPDSPTAHLPACRPDCLYMSIQLSIQTAFCQCLSDRLSICMAVNLSVYATACLFPWLLAYLFDRQHVRLRGCLLPWLITWPLICASVYVPGR